MISFDAASARTAILADLEAALPHLDQALRDWLRSHLVPPRPVALARKTDGANSEQFWLVTDHKGTNDALFRIVYDDVAKRYGIECAIQNDVSLFAGFRETLIDAVTDAKGVAKGVA